MTVIHPNSISGITSVTSHSNSLYFYESDHSTKLTINAHVNGNTSGTASNLTGSPSINVTNITASGNVSIGGTLTYEDVTNIDSVGIITAQAGINVTGGRLLVGTTSARSDFFNANTVAPSFQVQGTGNARIASITAVDTSSSSGAALILAKSRSTGNTIVQDNDTLGAIEFQGSDGSEIVVGAQIKAQVDGTPGANDMPTRLMFGTTADGASAQTERLRIDSSGRLGLGAFNNSSYDSIGQNFLIANESSHAGMTIRSGGSGAFGAIHFADGVSDNNEKRAGRILYGHGDNFMSFHTANVERLRIDSSGRVLISGQDILSSTSLTHRLQVKSQNDANAIAIIGRNGDDIGELSYYEADKTTKLGEVQYRQDHVNIRHRVGDIRFATGGTTERLRIDSSGLIGNNGRVPSNYGSPNLLLSGTDSTLTLMGDGSTNNSSYAGIKFRVAGASAGDYTKAGIFVQRQDSYNDLDMIFAFRSTNDAAGVAISPDEKVRITSDGYVMKPASPSFLARLSSGNINIATSGNSDVVFNDEYFDNANNYNTSNGRFTAPIAGKYFFGVQLYTGFSVTAVRVMHAKFNKNGNVYAGADMFGGINADGGTHYHPTGCATTMIHLAANDYVTFNLGSLSVTGSGNSTLYASAGTRFFGYLIG